MDASFRRFLPVSGLPFAISSLVYATSFYAQPFPETVQDAPVIVRGKVGGSYGDWGVGPDGGKRIYTFYELQVDEALKGQVQVRNLTMRELGGEKDGVGMQVAGASQFNRGEDVVVMLSDRNPDGSYDVRGLMMGKLNIKQDESGKEVLVGPALQATGEEMIHEGGQPDTASKAKWTLDSLRSLIAQQKSQTPATPTSANSPSNRADAAAVHASPSPAPSASSVAPRLLHTPAEGPSETPVPAEARENASGGNLWLILVGIFAASALGLWGARRKKRR